MKTSIQKQFDILLIAAQTGCSKLEAVAASKGWGFKTTSTEKVEEIKAAVKAVAVKRSIKLRKAVTTAARRHGRKNVSFPRYVGRLVVAVNTTTVDLTAQLRAVKAQSRAKSVALKGYIKTLAVATKAASKVSEVESKTVGWSAELLKVMGKQAQAVAALEVAKAAL